jgi:alpha-beta hydrolase superfamily lysophospholipase
MIQNSPYPVPSATVEWAKASYIATQFIRQPENLAKLKMPVLVLCGTEEKVVDPNFIPQWIGLAKDAGVDVEFNWIQGGYHELLAECRPIITPVMEIIRTWFDKKGFMV